jgi:vanillate O-demethylase ferredoxin subunit
MNTPLPLLVRVAARREEAEGIVSFALAALDGAALPAFSAGAHIDVEVRPGLVRQYSLCNHPSEQHRYLIAVLHTPDSRGGSRGMHESVRLGDTVRISAPKNHFELQPASRYLLLAGGIGVTPILCMAERLAETGAGFAMHYSCRSPERAAFRERIRDAAFAERVAFHFDSEGERCDLKAILASEGPGTHLYVCGPPGFIDAVTGAANDLGWERSRVHLEYFAAPPSGTQANGAFEVRIASSGRTIAIPADQSVLGVLQAHGIEIPASCEQGVCGTCLTRVLDGVPEHRDSYLTDEERAANDQFTPCCSRARSGTLVLDL